MMAISGRANSKLILQKHESGRKSHIHGSLNATGHRLASNGLSTEKRVRSDRKGSQAAGSHSQMVNRQKTSKDLDGHNHDR